MVTLDKSVYGLVCANRCRARPTLHNNCRSGFARRMEELEKGSLEFFSSYGRPSPFSQSSNFALP